jgi:hypothetical protein
MKIKKIKKIMKIIKIKKIINTMIMIMIMNKYKIIKNKYNKLDNNMIMVI